MATSPRHDPTRYPLLDTALALHGHGISVIPAATTGTKAPWPDGARWQTYQQQRADPNQLTAWFATGRYDGLGVVCGPISGGLEMVELEGRATAAGLDTALDHLATAAGLTNLWDRVTAGYQERTPSDGIHWLWRCTDLIDHPVGNLKLARRPGPDATIDVLAETRGVGGFAVVAPSGGRTHPTGGGWDLELGGPDTIATVTADERDQLLDLFRALDEMPAVQPPTPAPTRHHTPDDGARPGDDYNAATTWAQLLQPRGWTHVFTRGETSYWRRPGKTEGLSATTNHGGADLLIVFTTSTTFDNERGYDRFGAYALLEHGGDLAAAARQLRRDGYGALPSISAPLLPAGPPPAAPPPDDDDQGDGDEPPPAAYEPSDLGNCRRFTAFFGDDVRYVWTLGRWLLWTGTHWSDDAEGEIVRLAKTTVDRILTDADTTPRGDRDALLKHWRRSQAAARIGSMIELARSERPIATSVDALDVDPWTVTTPSGHVDLRTGTLRPADRAALSTRCTRAAYDPAAQAPVFHAFLERIIPNADTRAFLQRLFGYALNGTTSEHILPIFWGAGANGKTTLLEAVRHAIGDYGHAAPSDLLLATTHEAHPTGTAGLRGRRLVICSEIDEGRRLDEATVKKLTGGDRLTARFMRQDYFEFVATHTLVLATNHRPEVRGTDNGIWRRLRLVPFTETIPPEEQDHDLPAKLAAEADGILAWIVAGALDWAAGGLRAPADVLAATDDYRGDQDHVGRFLEACFSYDGTARVGARELRQTYENWCHSEGERSMSAKALGPRLRTHGLDQQDIDRRSFWLGVELAPHLAVDF